LPSTGWGRFLLQTDALPQYTAGAGREDEQEAPMNTYSLLKHIHLLAVAVTLVLFVLRGAWMMLDSPMLARRWVRIVPHVNDTVLLISALWMAIGVWRYPMVFHGWITAKLVALVVYILLGTVALKRGRTKATRGAAFLVGLAVFAYIVHTAYTKTVVPV
jgi:uncharacterized membrane protein SirB2